MGAWRVSRGADSRIVHLHRFARDRSDRLVVVARVAWAAVERGSAIVPQPCRGISAAAGVQAPVRVRGWAIVRPRCLAPLEAVAPALAAIGRRRCRATSAVAIVPPRSPAVSVAVAVAPAVLTGPVSVG